MANQFTKQLTTNVGTGPATVYATGVGTRATVIGINIANTTANSIVVSIQFVDDAANITGYIVKDVVIAKGTSLAAIGGDQKLVMEPEDSITVSSNTAASADVLVSALEITA